MTHLLAAKPQSGNWETEAPPARDRGTEPTPTRAGQGWASLREAYDLALAGGLGALFGLYLFVEMVQTESDYLRDALAGTIIGGSIGYFLNAWGPFRDGAWRKLAHAVTWGVPAAALGGAAGLVLGEVVIGSAGRRSEDEITRFTGGGGLGIQFAAVAELVFRKASAAGLGRELPTEWFTQEEKP